MERVKRSWVQEAVSGRRSGRFGCLARFGLIHGFSTRRPRLDREPDQRRDAADDHGNREELALAHPAAEDRLAQVRLPPELVDEAANSVSGADGRGGQAWP